MKPLSVSFMATVLILVAGMSKWHVSAQQPAPAGKAIPSLDPLSDWRYPGANLRAESNGDRNPLIPLHGILARTSDSIETVYVFYRKKIEPNFVAKNAWHPDFQHALLMNQTTHGNNENILDTPRQDADSALMVIRQPQRTITVQISRDPQDKTTTDILLVADEH